MKITFKDELTVSGGRTDEEIIERLIKSRNIEDVEHYIDPPSPLLMNIADFGYKDEVQKTVEILTNVKEKDGTVVVYTDYDADGITGGTILWETLHLLGFKVMPYVPHRKHEGYGFSIKGIDSVREKYNPSLIISVDHGIAAAEKVTYAKSIGIPIIITDHHLKPELIPLDAEAIFHIPALSGSGVSYFFSKMIYEHFGDKAPPHNQQRLQRNFETDYVSIASVGTIADLVPLIGPSRSIAKYGLAAFPQMDRVGFKHLFKEAGIEGKKITPYEVGFVIAPRINAIGRLEHALDALRLLCTTSEERAYSLASKMGTTNQNRQELVKEAIVEAKQQVEQMGEKADLPRVLTLVSTSWHEGIIGLIASKMVDLYSRPVIVMTQGDGFLKGSARSISVFHITNFLRSLKDYLIDAGGHQQAAGFTLKAEMLDAFREQVTLQSAKLLKEEDLVRVIEADLKIPVTAAKLSLVQKLEKLEPFGIGNPQPLFYSEAEIVDAKLFGKTKTHLKIFIKTPGVTHAPLELIAFSAGDRYPTLTKGQTIRVAYNLEVDRWGYNEKLRGRAKDWL